MSAIITNAGDGGGMLDMLRNGLSIANCQPWVGTDGNSYVTEQHGMTTNAEGQSVPEYKSRRIENGKATLTKEAWIHLEATMQSTFKSRLTIVSDIYAAGLRYNMPNGMADIVLQSQRHGDSSPASISMDGMREAPTDRFEIDSTLLPLPIIHKDFQMTSRQQATSVKGGLAFDTTNGEMAAREIAEALENLVLGQSGAFNYGGGTIYGLTNYPDADTQTLTAPGSSTGATLVDEIIAMRKKAYDMKVYGPFQLYNSPSWDALLDTDYSAVKGDNTIRDRVKKISGIMDMKTVDFLDDDQILLVAMRPDVIRMVNGLDLTTISWQEHGGMLNMFKLMTIQVPQIRSDFNENTGIVVGAVA
jgi:uncharacterized linocin/CFP29 family protein